MIVAISLGVGLGVDLHPEALAPLPGPLRLIFSSGISTGGLVALGVNLLLAALPPMTSPRRPAHPQRRPPRDDERGACGPPRRLAAGARGGFIVEVGTGETAASGRCTPPHDARGGIRDAGPHQHAPPFLSDDGSRLHAGQQSAATAVARAHEPALAGVHGGGFAPLFPVGPGGNDAHGLHDRRRPSLRGSRGQRRLFRRAVPGGGATGRALPRRAWQHGCRFGPDR